MSPEEKVIQDIESLMHRLKDINDQLTMKYPKDDLRLSLIGLPGNALHSNLLHMAMAVYTITHKAWWKVAYQKEEPTANDLEALRNLDSMTRHATFVFFLSRIEWNFRKLITFLFPGACANGSSAFKNVYEHLFKNLGLTRFIPLYDLCRLTRNSLHSNGIFISRTAANEMINWNGQIYNFTHMQSIDFMDYDTQISIYKDLIDSLEALLAIPAVQKPTYIEDKIH